MTTHLRRLTLALTLTLLLTLVAPFAVFGANEAPVPAMQPLALSTETPTDTPAAGADDGLFSPPFEPGAEAVCLINEDTGLTVYQKNADAPMVAASLVKMVTAILVADHVPDFDAVQINSDKDWVYDDLFGKNASHADIRKGETLTVRELLYALLLPSGNEAALLLADYVGGDIPAFLEMMQTRVQELGCTATTFADPHGIAEGNQTTARDMAKIVSAFMSYPELVAISGTGSYEMAQHEQHSAPYFITNSNLTVIKTNPYYHAFPSVAGHITAGKTGSLASDWQNFASQATKDDVTYTLVVLHSPHSADTLGDDIDMTPRKPALYESAKLYDWAFSALEIQNVLNTTQPITEVPVRYSSESDSVMLLPATPLNVVLPVDADDVDIAKTFNLPDFVNAPVEEGDEIGSVTILVAGKEVGTAKLLAQKNVKRNLTLLLVRKVQEFFGSIYFKILILVVVVAVLLYLILVAFTYFLGQNKGG